MRSLAQFLAVAILAVGTLAADARAHAVLVEASPADGAVLAAAPDTLTLRFNEPVALVGLRVLGPGNREILLTAPPRAENDRVSAPLPAALPPGGYTISYRVASADSHPVAGSIVFKIGAAAGSTALAPAPAGSNPGAVALDLGLRIALHLAVLGASGLALFAAAVAPLSPGLARALPAMALLGALLAAATVGARGAVLADLPPGALLDEAAWRTGGASTQAARAIAAAIGLALIAASLALPARIGRWFGALGALAAVGGTALTGHVAGAAPRWLMLPALVVHALGVACWLGSLAPLAVALRGAPDAAACIVTRFSRLAVPAVAAILASGAVIAWVQVRDPLALLATEYGRVLLLKLAMVAGVLAIAERNRRHLTPALPAVRPGAAEALRAAIRVEALLIAGAIAAAAFLGATPPPRAALKTASPPSSIETLARSESMSAALVVSPGRVGDNRIVLRLAARSGGAIQPKEVTLALEHRPLGLGPIERNARARPDGSHVVESAPLPAPGPWSARIDVLVSDFEKVILRTEFTIP